jgi:hypothetical protein
VIEYRVLWCEMIAGKLIPFSGRVMNNFEDVWYEAALKRVSHNYHGIMIEARLASSDAWPTPWDEVESLRAQLTGSVSCD